MNYPKINDDKIVTKKFNFIRNISNLINSDLKNIKKIILPDQGIKDISIIKFEKLVDLTELDLSHNNITNIEPLSKYKLPYLTKLNLSVNFIDDNNKKYCFKLDFPELTNFNIYENRLTDYEIFKFNNNKNLPKLEVAYFGGNNFKFPDSQIDKKRIKI